MDPRTSKREIVQINGFIFRGDRLTRWHAVATAAMAACAIAATSDVWADIFLLARRDEENSHILLVPLVAAWLVWVRRLRLRYCKPKGAGVGVAIAACGWMAMEFGSVCHHQSAWHAGAALIVLGCVISVLGRDALLRFFPVICVLAFLVPLPVAVRQAVALPLQSWTAQTSQIALQSLGVSAERYGNTLQIHGVAVNIVEACNGLRMAFALILVCFAFAFGLPLRNRVRLLVLAASPIAAIVCNVLRIVPTLWVYSSQDRPIGDRFHDVSGWLMLPASFLLLLGIIKALRWAMIPVTRYTLAG